jgi:dynein heavy chain
LHAEVEENFRKTVANFYYEFSVRHLINIPQGLLVDKPETIKEPDNLIKLRIHESERIYGNRLVSAENFNVYKAAVFDL